MSAPLLATFRAKVRTMHAPDGAPLYNYVAVPKLTRQHVSMNAARTHPRFGDYANSDLFPTMLNHCAAVKAGTELRLDQLPPGVSADTTGFLAVVTVEVTR